MTIQEILSWGGSGLLLLSLIQISPLKLNPWTALGKGLKQCMQVFGRTLNAEVLAKLETLETGQKNTRDKLDEHIRLADKREADEHRNRILHFNVELLQNVPHTREDFIEILAEIDHYERYCKENPDYENNRAVHAIANIGRVYDDRLRKHDFK